MTPIPRRSRRHLSPEAAADRRRVRRPEPTGPAGHRRRRRRRPRPVGLRTAQAADRWARQPSSCPTDVSDSEKILKWANWTAYLDMNGKETKSPTLDAFMEQTGIEVSYSEDIDDNDSYYAKIGPQLRAGQSIDRDIFTMTDWMAARMIRDQLCQPLELIQMPNVVNNLLQPLKDVSFDPGRQHSITWQSGFAGIGYNKEKVGRELKSLDDLWADDLKGRIVVLSEFRDTAGLVMQSQGVDIDSDWGKAEFESGARLHRAARSRTATSAR